VKHCQAKQLTPKTIGGYQQKLEVFRLYMAQVHHIASVGSVTFVHIQGFLTALQRPGSSVSDATVKGYIQVLKGFFMWCEKQGYARYNPAKIAGSMWKVYD
jgi:site-specific recombinase XerD